MPVNDDPSDCLAQLIETTRAWLATPDQDANAAFARAFANVRATGNVEAGGMSAAEVMARAPVRTAIGLIDKERDDEEAGSVLHAITILDEWHAPVSNDLSGEQWILTPDHTERLVRLDVSASFNLDQTLGSLIPRNGPDWRAQDDEEVRRRISREYEIWDDEFAPPSLASLLTYVSHLPPTIAASADNGDGEPHRVRVVYLRPAAADTPIDIVDPLTLTIAPVLETPEDVTLSKLAEHPAYIVKPHLLADRLRALVEQAYLEGSGVLLLPEMSLCEDGLETLQGILAERHASYLGNGGDQPPLGWIFAGVASKRDGVRNFVAVLAGDGGLLLEQDKFSRWNLNVEEQRQYELLGHAEEGPERLKEHIEPATHVHVIDLPGLGRTVVLICADMDVPEPGDCLYANAGLDWIYAPIMDRSRSPHVAKEERPWIVARAYRAAELARARVAVTNSMPLTSVINRSNAQRGIERPAFTSCHIGFLCEGHIDGVVAQSIEVDLNASDVAVSCRWGEGWMPELAAPALKQPPNAED